MCNQCLGVVWSIVCCLAQICVHDLDLGFQISKELEEQELNALRASCEDPPDDDGADLDGGDEDDEKASIITCSMYVQSRTMYVIVRAQLLFSFCLI